MRIKLLSAYSEPSPNHVAEWLTRHGGAGGHELVDDPEAADLIIFAETFGSLDPFFLDVIWHPVFRRHRQKCVLHHNADGVVTFCRTVSPSVEKWQPNQNCRRSFHYIARRRDITIPAGIGESGRRRLLFSFQGDVSTHEVRQRVIRLRHAEALLENIRGSAGDRMAVAEREAFQARYCQTIVDSEFVLCPRGLGPASMRIFEVMQLGRAPVILADAWKPVAGIPWHECAIFVPERDVEEIPRVLEARRTEAAAMGRRAREIWEGHFAPERSLERLINEAALTLAARHEAAADWKQLLPRRYWRSLAASLMRRVRHGRADLRRRVTHQR
jgi:hypothetical protein